MPAAAGQSLPATTPEVPKIKPALQGKHPRLFVNAAGMQAAVERFRNNPVWSEIYFPAEGPEWKAQLRPLAKVWTGFPCEVFAKLAVGYVVTGEQRYLDRFRLWLPELQVFEPFTFAKIGVREDLLAGAMLTALAISYDVLEGRADVELVSAIRETLIKQARQTYKDLRAIPRYPYEQNHFSIPVGGLVLASLVLAGEEPETDEWAAWAIPAMRKCVETLGQDGWYFEGVTYWSFTIQFTITAVLAIEHATGENLFESPFLKNSGNYLAHMFLPNPDFVFDFADWGPRMNQIGYDKPWHTLTNPQSHAPMTRWLPFVLNQANPHPVLAKLIAEWNGTGTGLEGCLGPLLQIPPNGAVAAPDSDVPPYHYFSDMDVVHWRESWDNPEATAIAFKCGPPGGHSMASLLEGMPDWRYSLGHAHPDAGTFIIFSKGAFLTNNPGYVLKKTEWHNTILIDGIGQEKEGTGFSTFVGVPYEKLNQIRMHNVWLGPSVMAATGDFAAAYQKSLGVESLVRDIILVDGRFLVVLDRMQSSEPREYSWRLHGDKEAEKLADGRFVMTNGHGRLVMQNLLPVAAEKVAPTIVETELQKPQTNPRPQQRGFHLELLSEKTAQHRFAVAMNIQSSDDDASAFAAQREGEGKFLLTDGRSTCTIWIHPSEELDGEFAYILTDGKGNVLSVGLSGKSLESADFALSLQAAGQVTLAAGDTGIPGLIPTSSDNSHAATIRLGENRDTVQIPGRIP